MFCRFRILVFLSFSILLMIFVNQTYGKDLEPYVRKYSKITVSQEQRKRIDKYSHLISYFSSFSFFRPHHKVSPDFVKALILAESDGNTFAISNKNALGLGQLLFSTANKAATEIYATGRNFRYIQTEKLHNLKKEDLFDPAINILLTCYLIAKYNYRFDGKLDLVVSAWNAGENVDSLKIGLPAPYSETYNLIGKVNGYYLYLLKY